MTGGEYYIVQVFKYVTVNAEPYVLIKGTLFKRQKWLATNVFNF